MQSALLKHAIKDCNTTEKLLLRIADFKKIENNSILCNLMLEKLFQMIGTTGALVQHLISRGVPFVFPKKLLEQFWNDYLHNPNGRDEYVDSSADLWILACTQCSRLFD
jgi:hypothetical protein